MWWSEDVVPGWLLRLLVFAGVAAAGAFAAVLAWFVLLGFDVGGDWLLGASIVHTEAVFGIAGVCGLAVGAAAASGRRADVDVRRAGVATGALTVLGVAAAVAVGVASDRDFSPAEFKAAAAAGDLEALQYEAWLAVEQDALVGMTVAEARSALGTPTRVARRRQLWIWDLGPRDAGTLRVRFDPSWNRVVDARIENPLDIFD